MCQWLLVLNYPISFTILGWWHWERILHYRFITSFSVFVNLKFSMIFMATYFLLTLCTPLNTYEKLPPPILSILEYSSNIVFSLKSASCFTHYDCSYLFSKKYYFTGYMPSLCLKQMPYSAFLFTGTMKRPSRLMIYFGRRAFLLVKTNIVVRMNLRYTFLRLPMSASTASP